MGTVKEMNGPKTTLGAEGWTISLKDHYDRVSELEEKLHTERDRRYAEVSQEREKALKIKEEADKTALGLAREIQTYKDERANQLRSQIEGERNLYPTKEELQEVRRGLELRLEAMKSSYAAKAEWTWQQILGISALLLAAAAIYFKGN